MADLTDHDRTYTWNDDDDDGDDDDDLLFHIVSSVRGGQVMIENKDQLDHQSVGSVSGFHAMETYTCCFSYCNLLLSVLEIQDVMQPFKVHNGGRGKRDRCSLY